MSVVRYEVVIDGQVAWSCTIGDHVPPEHPCRTPEGRAAQAMADLGMTPESHAKLEAEDVPAAAEALQLARDEQAKPEPGVEGVAVLLVDGLEAVGLLPTVAQVRQDAVDAAFTKHVSLSLTVAQLRPAVAEYNRRIECVRKGAYTETSTTL